MSLKIAMLLVVLGAVTVLSAGVPLESCPSPRPAGVKFYTTEVQRCTADLLTIEPEDCYENVTACGIWLNQWYPANFPTLADGAAAAQKVSDYVYCRLVWEHCVDPITGNAYSNPCSICSSLNPANCNRYPEFQGQKKRENEDNPKDYDTLATLKKALKPNQQKLSGARSARSGGMSSGTKTTPPPPSPTTSAPPPPPSTTLCSNPYLYNDCAHNACSAYWCPQYSPFIESQWNEYEHAGTYTFRYGDENGLSGHLGRHLAAYGKTGSLNYAGEASVITCAIRKFGRDTLCPREGNNCNTGACNIADC